MGPAHFGAAGDHVIGDRNAGGLEHDLGLVLVQRQGRGQHARMGIGNAQEFQHALDGPVLSKTAMQGIESDIGLKRAQAFGNVVADINFGHPITGAAQRLGTALARTQRYRALIGEPPHQDGDMFCHEVAPAPISASNSPGSAAAHWVMLPAPRQTT